VRRFPDDQEGDSMGYPPHAARILFASAAALFGIFCIVNLVQGDLRAASSFLVGAIAAGAVAALLLKRR
jgi:hypothetical protein